MWYNLGSHTLKFLTHVVRLNASSYVGPSYFLIPLWVAVIGSFPVHRNVYCGSKSIYKGKTMLFHLVEANYTSWWWSIPSFICICFKTVCLFIVLAVYIGHKGFMSKKLLLNGLTMNQKRMTSIILVADKVEDLSSLQNCELEKILFWDNFLNRTDGYSYTQLLKKISICTVFKSHNYSELWECWEIMGLIWWLEHVHYANWLFTLEGNFH